MNKINFGRLKKKFNSSSWIEDSLNLLLEDISKLQDGDYCINANNNEINYHHYPTDLLPQPTWDTEVIIPFRKLSSLLFLKIGCGLHWVCVCIDLSNGATEILYTDNLPSEVCWENKTILGRINEAEKLLKETTS